MTELSPIMAQAKKAAERVEQWSDSKKEYARRIVEQAKTEVEG